MASFDDFTKFSIPRFPESRASAKRGLFCFNNASWSGLAKNISRMTTGSSCKVDVAAGCGGRLIAAGG